MSFFKKMKEMFAPKDYETMTHNELLSLNDAELSGAISDRIFSRADVLNVEKMMTTLEGAKKTYYIIYTYDLLVGVGEKGGDYCLEKDKEIFPCLISALDEIGAYQNKYLVEQFASKYNVDLNHPDLIQFDILRQKNGQNQSPADEFKEAYEEILAQEDEMDMCLMAYARQHIEEF